jgi:hypothetical protein
VQLSEETWPDVVDRVKEIEVTLEESARIASSSDPAVPKYAEDVAIGPSSAATSSSAHHGMSCIAL